MFEKIRLKDVVWWLWIFVTFLITKETALADLQFLVYRKQFYLVKSNNFYGKIVAFPSAFQSFVEGKIKQFLKLLS